MSVRIDEQLARLLGAVTTRLAEVFTDPVAFRHVVGQLGWDVPEIPPAYGALATDAADLAELIVGLTDGADLVEIIEVIEGAVAVIDGVATLPPPPAVPDPAAFQADLAGPFVAELLVDALTEALPGPIALAAGVGVVELLDETNGPRPRFVHAVDLSLVRDVFTRPLPALRDRVGWLTSDTATADIIDLLASILDAFGLPVVPFLPSPAERRVLVGDNRAVGIEGVVLLLADGEIGGAAFEVGLELIAIDRVDAATPPRLLIRPVIDGDLNLSVDVADHWALTLTAALDDPDEPLASITPGQGIELYVPSGPPVVGYVTLSLDHTPTDPIRLFGSPQGSRLEADAFVISATLDADGAAGTFNVGSALTLSGAQLVIAAGDADSFLGSMLGSAETVVDVPLDASYSPATGFAVGGELGIEIETFPDFGIGPITVERLALALGVDLEDPESLFRFEAVVDIAAAVAVFEARVEGIGAGMMLGLPAGATTPVVSLGFIPPTAVGLSVSTEAVKGGGFLRIDAEIGRYSGALALEIISVGISAITVVDTQLPGNPDGFALFASLTATFPGIPLGFGFSLTGVGGLVAINRTIDAEALALGLRNGVVDSLLFPEDPVNEAAQIISQIDSYFPLLEGNSVFGPVIEISWGIPPLISAQLGVLISMPDGIIAVMGSVSALLPTPDAPLISINMDVLGVIDIPAGEFTMVASLYDSRLLETIELSGDMAMYLRATDQPYFLLSVGGYHPSFEPPSNLPASLHDLRRMTASIDIGSMVEVVIRSYFAVTSNTVQFGSSVTLEASVEIWPTTYSARGGFEFNILLQFSPFRILADMAAGVGIYSGNKELMGVHLGFMLEGPAPWYAIGTAEFKFFGIKVKFDFEVGGAAAGEPKPTVEVRSDVIAALESGASWSEAGPISGLTCGVVFAQLEEGDDSDEESDEPAPVWVRPDHQLRVSQSVAPLNRDLEIVGQAVPAAGHERITISSASIGSGPAVATDPAEDWFAPAQFESMGRTEKLGRASFEMMESGVSFGLAEAVVDASRGETVNTAHQVENYSEDDVDPLAHSARLGSAGEAMRFYAPPAEPMFAVSGTQYLLVDAVDGTPAQVGWRPDQPADGTSQRDALDLLAIAQDDDPGAAATMTVMPATAALGVS